MRFHGIGQDRFGIKDFPSEKRFQTNVRQLRSRVDPLMYHGSTNR